MLWSTLGGKWKKGRKDKKRGGGEEQGEKERGRKGEGDEEEDGEKVIRRIGIK